MFSLWVSGKQRSQKMGQCVPEVVCLSQITLPVKIRPCRRSHSGNGGREGHTIERGQRSLTRTFVFSFTDPRLSVLTAAVAKVECHTPRVKGFALCCRSCWIKGSGVTINTDSVLNTPAGKDPSLRDRLAKDNNYISYILNKLLKWCENVILNDEKIILGSP